MTKLSTEKVLYGANGKLVKAFQHAKCTSRDQAAAILFGADTRAAGHSQSHLGSQGYTSQVRTPEFTRVAAREAPSLPKNLKPGLNLFDAGDLPIAQNSSAAQQVEQVRKVFTEIWREKKVPLCIGGDHLIKHAALQALQVEHPGAVVLYLDAHPDIVMKSALSYETVIHEALVRQPTDRDKIYLVGLRQVNGAEAEGLAKWQPQVIWAENFYTSSVQEIADQLLKGRERGTPLYVSVDLDGLDPASAPAVEAPCPGGPLLGHFLPLLRLLALNFRIIGADVSEFIPDLDPQRITAMSATTILTEISSCID